MMKYYIGAGVFYALVFISATLHSFVLDMEYISPEKRYDLDRLCYEKEHHEPYMEYQTWLLDQDRKDQAWLDWIGDQCTKSFDWTQDSPSGYNSDNTERGRD
jgi:hypothetical protein